MLEELESQLAIVNRLIAQKFTGETHINLEHTTQERSFDHSIGYPITIDRQSRNVSALDNNTIEGGNIFRNRLKFEDSEQPSISQYQENFLVNEHDTKVQIELSKVSRLTERERTLRNEVSDLQQQLSGANQVITKLQADVAHLQKIETSYQKNQTFMVQLRDELNTTQSELTTKRQEIIQKDLLLQEAESELNALRKLNTEMIKTQDRKRNEDINKYTAEHNKLQKALNDKERYFNDASQIYEKQIEDLFRTLKATQSEVQVLRSQLERADRTAQIDKLENDNLVLHQLLQEQHAKAIHLEKEVKKHPQVIKEALAEAKQKEAHHDQKMSFLIKDNDAKDALIKQLRSGKTGPKEVEQLKEQISKLASENFRLNQELEDYQVQVEELEAQIQHEQQQHDAIISSMSRERDQELEDARQEIAHQFADQQKRSEEELRNQRMQIEKLKKDLDMWRINAQEQIRDDSKDQNMSLIIQGYDQEINLLAQKMKEQKDTISELRARNTQLSEEVIRYKKQ